MSLSNTRSATSSQASDCGAPRCVEADGQTMFPFGLDPVPASLSAPRDSSAGSTTTGICGPHGSVSSRSAALRSSLASKLRARTDLDGSILYRLIWKERITPGGRTILALRASRKRISVSGYMLSGWVTASSRDWKDTPGMATEREDGRSRAALAGWPTPCVVEPDTSPEKVWERKQRLTASTGVYRGNDCGLGSKVHLVGWPTPCQQDGPNGGPAQGQDRLPGAVALSGWPTPQAGTPAQNGNNMAGNTDSSRATVAAVQGPFAIRGKLTLQDDGSIAIGYCVETLPESQSGGPLNPEHSRWLMALSPEWANCAPTETASILKRRRNSAGR